MSETIKEKLDKDPGYQAFSNLMDMVFEIADELHNKIELTNVEYEFIDAFDEYIASMIDEEEDTVE